MTTQCCYCGGASPAGKRNHTKCDMAQRSIRDWVREEPVDAVVEIATAIAERIKQGDAQAMRWLLMAVSNYETGRLHLSASEIAEIAVTAGAMPEDMPGYADWEAEKR